MNLKQIGQINKTCEKLGKLQEAVYREQKILSNLSFETDEAAVLCQRACEAIRDAIDNLTELLEP